MVYGYARVSTREQNEDRQLAAFEDCRFKIDRIFIDKQSGKDFNRVQYRQMIRAIRKGDVVVIKSIDRLGRNYSEIIEQWRGITKVKRADIAVLDMPILDTTQNKDLIGTLISDLVLQLLSYVAENERINIRQRQREGIAAAKKRGVKFGRPKYFNALDYTEIYERYKRHELTRQEAMDEIGCSKNTYYRIVHEIKWEKRKKYL